jgi:hypothetical protein
MGKWTEIVDGKRRAKKYLDWDSDMFSVSIGNWQYSFHESVRGALAECHFRDLIEGQTLNEEKSQYGTLIYYGQLMHEGRDYRIRVYFGGGQRHSMIMDEWDKGRPISEAYKATIYREETFTSYMNELLDSIRTFWRANQ